MKRTVLLFVTAAMLATQPAKAGNDEMAYGIAGIIAYNETCGPVPTVILETARTMKQTIPAAMYDAAAEQLFMAYVRLGKTEWCAKVKEIING